MSSLSINGNRSVSQNDPVPQNDNNNRAASNGLSLATKITILAVAILFLPAVAYSLLGSIPALITALAGLVGSILLITKCGNKTQVIAERTHNSVSSQIMPSQVSQQQHEQKSSSAHPEQNDPQTLSHVSQLIQQPPLPTAPQKLVERLAHDRTQPKFDLTNWLNQQNLKNADIDDLIAVLSPEDISEAALADVFGYQPLVDNFIAIEQQRLESDNKVSFDEKASEKLEYIFKRMSENQLKAWIVSTLSRHDKSAKIEYSFIHYKLLRYCEIIQKTRPEDEWINLWTWILRELQNEAIVIDENTPSYFDTPRLLKNLYENVENQDFNGIVKTHELIVNLSTLYFVERLKAAKNIEDCKKIESDFAVTVDSGLFDKLIFQAMLPGDLDHSVRNLWLQYKSNTK